MHFRELFEIRHQWTSDRVKRSVRLTTTRKIYMRNAISIGDLAIASETVEDKRQSIIALDIAWAFEVFIEHRADEIFG